MTLRSKLVEYLMERRYPKEPEAGVIDTGWTSVYKITDDFHDYPKWGKKQKMEVIRNELIALALQGIVEGHPSSMWKESLFRINEII